jgi:alkylation response protein AidB-like acyl-CoA dehydrogenase
VSTADLTITGALGVDELAEWRAEIAAWLAEHVPHGWRERMTGASEDEYLALQRAWLAELHGAGLAAPHWPVEWGGAGFDLARQVVLAEELARAGAPYLGTFHVGLYHAAATLLGEGNDEQRARLLPGILAGELWCQGFSEPNAGSDLASLRTRARRDGDDYVISGQKIWTSYATHADWCILLARTDPAAPKHQGISYFVLDMHAPGIEIRPIRTSIGDEEFAELFLDEVRIPVTDRIGAENDGWAITQRTLSEERGPHTLEGIERLRVARRQLVRDLAAVLPDWEGTSVAGGLVQELGAVQTELEVLRLLAYRVLDGLRTGGHGPESSMLKIRYREALGRTAALGVRIKGLDSQLRRPFTHGVHWESTDWMVDYVDSWAWTIAGGSNEIQRNILAERVLGLPRG